MERQQEIRKQILNLTKEYYSELQKTKTEFTPGGRVSYSGRVYDESEMVNLVESSLDFWLTSGRYAKEFETRFGEKLGMRYCSLVNSGSSANLLAFMALTSHMLGERRIRKGDEVITVAAGFPTTVAPIMQYGAVPVFVDVTIPQYNIDVKLLEAALSEKTKAVMIAHTLGNPFDIQEVKNFCDKHELWLIEDNCDALGTEYLFDGKMYMSGTVGDIGTSSFYPPHHITMGEGGAVYTNNPLLNRIVRSLRDWGRDCFCEPGQDGKCGHRYEQQFGELPIGFDHKYVYSHLGYNLKATDMQAAVGCAQLVKLDGFTETRRENWKKLHELLADTENVLILPEPLEGSKPSWFGFAITVKENAQFSRNELVDELENHNIQTRNLFAGNLIKHPCFDEFRGDESVYRVVGNLTNTDLIMMNTFWIGVYPGMTDAKIQYMSDVIHAFLKEKQ